MIKDHQAEYSLKDSFNKISFYIRYLLSKWVVILTGVFLGVFLGVIKYYNTKPLYTANLTYVIGESPNSSSGLTGLASQFGFTPPSNGFALFEGSNLKDLMKSRIILQKVLLSKLNSSNDTLIGDKYIDVYKLREKWAKNKSPLANLYFRNLKSKDTLPQAYNVMLNQLMGTIRGKNLSLEKTNDKSNLQPITFTSENELLSKSFVDVLAVVVSKYYIEAKTEKFSKNVNILQKQTDSVRHILGGAVTSVAILADINPNPNPSRRSLLVPSQNKQIDVQANTAILTQLIQNLEFAKLQLRNETPLFQIVDQPVLPLDVVKMSLMISIVLGGFAGLFITVAFFTVLLFFKSLK